MALFLYMDNYRGFKDTIVSIDPITFLVGENSTGKSSLLKLLRAFSDAQFWFDPGYILQEFAELGSYEDIVSATSSDKSSFSIGIIKSQAKKENGVISYSFAILRFKSKDGSPYLYKYVQYQNGVLSKLVYQKNQIKYKIESVSEKYICGKKVIEYFKEINSIDKTDTKGYTVFPSDELVAPPVPFALSIITSTKKVKHININDLYGTIPFAFDLTWIAPIRTKPQRFYDGTKRRFSPEGEHIPYILRSLYRAKVSSRKFVSRLKEFGDASGLYETIIPRIYGNDLSQSPFEIMILLSGAKYNLSNVGYGVSQILPLIVEFLYRKDESIFAVQQPEVHLHPRAQAALGDLIAELAFDKNHKFIIETHSDYLIDRCRLNLSKKDNPPNAQVTFFKRSSTGNEAIKINIERDGKYNIDNQPPEFREFFLKEGMDLLEV